MKIKFYLLTFKTEKIKRIVVNFFCFLNYIEFLYYLQQHFYLFYYIFSLASLAKYYLHLANKA
jgi:hypothetical protein